jgi:uncharacterized membrane protein YdjX (TVP38/TMEM64 family)
MEDPSTKLHPQSQPDSDQDGSANEAADRRPSRGQRRHRLGTTVTLAAIGLILVGVVLLFVLAGEEVWRYFRNPAELRQLVRGWGPGAPVGIVLLQVVQVVIAPLPGNVVSFATGYTLGFWPGILWVMLGVLVGATVDFALARLLGRRLMRYLMPADRLARLDSLIIRRGTFYLFLLLLIPNPVGDLTYYLAGLTPLPLPLYLTLVLVGKLPSNVLECWLGSKAVEFGWKEWGILAAVAIALAAAYFANQGRISRLLERWSHIPRRSGRA